VLRAAHPSLRLRLVGRDDEGAVAAAARAAGAEAVGWAADLLPHYRESTAVYLPIRSGGGTRIKVLEAFALGRPVLSTAVGVEGLEVAPDEHYLAIDTPAQGAAALARVLAGGAAAMVRAARDRVEARWSREAAVARLTELVRGVL
jgi:glycosyltransferase involved in cell wall biosynthesis